MSRLFDGRTINQWRRALRDRLAREFLQRQPPSARPGLTRDVLENQRRPAEIERLKAQAEAQRRRMEALAAIQRAAEQNRRLQERLAYQRQFLQRNQPRLTRPMDEEQSRRTSAYLRIQRAAKEAASIRPVRPQPGDRAFVGPVLPPRPRPGDPNFVGPVPLQPPKPGALRVPTKPITKHLKEFEQITNEDRRRRAALELQQEIKRRAVPAARRIRVDVHILDQAVKRPEALSPRLVAYLRRTWGIDPTRQTDRTAAKTLRDMLLPLLLKTPTDATAALRLVTIAESTALQRRRALELEDRIERSRRQAWDRMSLAKKVGLGILTAWDETVQTIVYGLTYGWGRGGWRTALGTAGLSLQRLGSPGLLKATITGQPIDVPDWLAAPGSKAEAGIQSLFYRRAREASGVRSPGQWVSAGLGHIPTPFDAAGPRNIWTAATGKVTSGVVDAIFQIVSDPTTLITMGLTSAAQAGLRSATQSAIRIGASGLARGEGPRVIQNTIEEIAQAALRADDTVAFRRLARLTTEAGSKRRLRYITEDAAESIFLAAKTEGDTPALRKAIAESLIQGKIKPEWKPIRTTVRAGLGMGPRQPFLLPDRIVDVLRQIRSARVTAQDATIPVASDLALTVPKGTPVVRTSRFAGPISYGKTIIDTAAAVTKLPFRLLRSFDIDRFALNPDRKAQNMAFNRAFEPLISALESKSPRQQLQRRFNLSRTEAVLAQAMYDLLRVKRNEVRLTNYKAVAYMMDAMLLPGRLRTAGVSEDVINALVLHGLDAVTVPKKWIVQMADDFIESLPPAAVPPKGVPILTKAEVAKIMEIIEKSPLLKGWARDLLRTKQGRLRLRRLLTNPGQLIKFKNKVIRVQTLRQASYLASEAIETSLPKHKGIARALAGAALTPARQPVGPYLRTSIGPAVGTNLQSVHDTLIRLVDDLGLDPTSRREVMTNVMRVNLAVAEGVAPKQLQTLVKHLVDNVLRTVGIRDPKVRRILVETAQGTNHDARRIVQTLYNITPEGKYPHLLTQMQSAFVLPNMRTFRLEMSKILAEQGVRGAKVRVILHKTGDFGMTIMGRRVTITGTLTQIHSFWKAMVTLRLYAPLLFVAAWLSAGRDDTEWDNWFLAGAAAAGIGFSGVVRYLARNSLQARITKMLAVGMTPHDMIPGWTRMRTWARTQKWGEGMAVAAELPDNVLLRRRPWLVSTGQWDIYNKQQLSRRNFARHYWRIINLQVRPETDVLMHIALVGIAKNKHPDKIAQDILRYITSTRHGQALLDRALHSGVQAPGDLAQRYVNFVEALVPRPIAAERLLRMEQGQYISLDWLRANYNILPDQIYAEKFKARIGQDLVEGYRGIFRRGVENAPLLRNVSKGTYDVVQQRVERSLVNLGLPREQAELIGIEIATDVARRVVYRQENVSVLARAVDWVFPFSGDIEYTFREWGRAVLTHPLRAARFGFRVAQAFNHSMENGTFQKDDFTGAWTVRMPGSLPLSRALFGRSVNMELSMTVDGFLPIAAGMYRPTDDEPAWYALTSFGPSPGGLFWSQTSRIFAELYPDAYTNLPPVLRDWLFGPVVPTGRFMPQDVDRLWFAIANDLPPWAFSWLGRDAIRDEIRKWEIEVFRQLYADYVKTQTEKNLPVDPEWQPSEESVVAATSALFKAWGFWRGVLPATPYPIMPNRKEFNEVWKVARAVARAETGLSDEELDGPKRYEVNWRLKNLFPAFAPYLRSSSEYVGPNDRPGPTTAEQLAIQRFLKHRRQLSYREYTSIIREQARREAAFDEYRAHRAVPNTFARLARLDEWDKKYPTFARERRNEALAFGELEEIVRTTPKQHLPRALAQWRATHNISKSKQAALLRQVRRAGMFDPWAVARDHKDVWEDVKSRAKLRNIKDLGPTNPFVMSIVQELPPAEQIKWAQYGQYLLLQAINASSPFQVIRSEDFMTAWNAYSQVQIAARNDPALTPSPWWSAVRKVWRPYDEAVQRWRGDQNKHIQELYDRAVAIRAFMDQAAQKKQWNVYRMLRKTQEAIFEQIRVYRNMLYKTTPDLSKAMDEIQAILFWAEVNELPTSERNKAIANVLARARQHPTFLASNEELRYLSMPEPVRKHYVESLLTRLMVPVLQARERGRLNIAFKQYEDPMDPLNVRVTTGLRWSWLSRFQQELIERNFPEFVEQFKWLDTIEDDGTGGRGRRGRRGRRRGRVRFAYGRGPSAELQFALETIRKYSNRGDHVPPGVKEYLALPAVPEIRLQFLEKHPDVANWINTGPLSRMPPELRDSVMNIIIKHGKWEFDPKSPEGRAELGFAYAQFRIWNRRGNMARPAALDVWMSMPSGPEKAQYLRDHPELALWFRLGPMANMPAAYREVVRDIMIKYKKWGDEQDGLAEIVNRYYRTPQWARARFLEEHPELLEYWRLSGGDDDAHLYYLMDQYLAIATPFGRRAFLHTYPELQEHLVERRTRQFERFLNQVAVYMGQNPELFEAYLVSQEETFRMLLQMFGEIPIIGGRRTPSARTTRTESGRVRVPVQPGR